MSADKFEGWYETEMTYQGFAGSYDGAKRAWQAAYLAGRKAALEEAEKRLSAFQVGFSHGLTKNDYEVIGECIGIVTALIDKP